MIGSRLRRMSCISSEEKHRTMTSTTGSRRSGWCTKNSSMDHFQKYQWWKRSTIRARTIAYDLECAQYSAKAYTHPKGVEDHVSINAIVERSLMCKNHHRYWPWYWV